MMPSTLWKLVIEDSLDFQSNTPPVATAAMLSSFIRPCHFLILARLCCGRPERSVITETRTDRRRCTLLLSEDT